MIVDIHAHTFPDAIAAATVDKLQAAAHIHPFTNGTIAALGASTRAAGITYAVNLPVATSPRQVTQINDTAARINERTHETGVLSFGAMHPDFTDWHAELGRVAALGIRGIKLHPPYQGADFDDIRYLRILDRAGELGLVVLTHAGLDIGLPDANRVTPQMIRRAIAATNFAPLICAHMGGWREWDAVEELLPETGVYLDTSFSLGRVTPKGDGYPWTETKLSLMAEAPWGGQSDAVERLRRLPLTDTEQAVIFGGNAAQLLKL